MLFYLSIKYYLTLSTFCRPQICGFSCLLLLATRFGFSANWRLPRGRRLRRLTLKWIRAHILKNVQIYKNIISCQLFQGYLNFSTPNNCTYPVFKFISFKVVARFSFKLRNRLHCGQRTHVQLKREYMRNENKELPLLFHIDHCTQASFSQHLWISLQTLLISMYKLVSLIFAFCTISFSDSLCIYTYDMLPHKHTIKWTHRNLMQANLNGLEKLYTHTYKP